MYMIYYLYRFQQIIQLVHSDCFRTLQGVIRLKLKWGLSK
jgi:hypothetical protein